MSKKKLKKEKVYAFIDSQNLNLGTLKQIGGWKLDYKKFRLYLKNKHNVVKAFLFIGHVPGNESLYTYLQKCGYILVFKPTLEIKKGKMVKVKGNVDAELVLHTMLEIDSFDRAIIVSGDGDFYCLLEYLEQAGKLGKILVPNYKYSGLLRKFNKGSYIQHISNLKERLKE